ncbi:hypothetical protein F2Q69_00019807 [Brassica cretica]|uniref:Uncharacterized protein n=1 Tax=Brassica cretica TaxID=69181 RepID=A0A8S9QRW8_BRACR|nr:hypothetical protein F2Q69_00019807 [Brassica cretica]
MQVFQIWKTSGLEDFQTTSTRLPGSLVDDFQEVFRRIILSCLSFIIDLSVLILIRWFSSSTWIYLDQTLEDLLELPDDFKEVFQTTSKKSSRRLPGGLLAGSFSISSGV